MKTILKTAAGICVGLLIAELFCSLYYSPAVYVHDEYRATDVVRKPNSISSRATEGFSREKMDGNGYNNACTYDDGDIFVLMMGSSHVEGLNVAQDETIASQLSVCLNEQGSEGSVYNIGISKHNLTRNLANLDRALDRFEPNGYVVVETSSAALNATAINAAVNDAVSRLPATADGGKVMRLLSRSSFLCTLYRQYQYYIAGQEGDEAGGNAVSITEELLQDYRTALTELFSQAAAVCEEHGVRLIIVYHPPMTLTADGMVVIAEDAQVRAAFASACEEAGVEYIDMSGIFLDAYETDNRVPYGFINTAPCTGHLNAYGCGLVAQAVSDRIVRLEAEK